MFLRPEAKNANDITLVTPTGFEPVLERGHVFAKSLAELRLRGIRKSRRNQNTEGVTDWEGVC